ncbi:MAG TPA: hypothetical protein VF648_09725 [Pyrinomonadaceae bacterium]|jgi:thioredoxin-related protein
MNTIGKKIETVANIAVILVCLLLFGFLINKWFNSKQNQSANSLPAEKNIPAGTKINLPEIDWSKNGRTLLVVLQKGCRFCTESGGFYQRLVNETANYTDLKLVAILPQKQEDSKAYLSQLGVNINEIRQSTLSALGVAGTPTLILIDDQGKVVNSWVGRLPEIGEKSVLAALQ